MKAYIIGRGCVNDKTKAANYMPLAKEANEKFGGKYLTRGGLLEVVQSDLWSPTRLVLVEFPSMDKARAFHNSDEYADVKKIRLDHAESTLVILEGL